MNIDRGSNGRNARIRSLDTESHSDFVRGFRKWSFTELDEVAERHAASRLSSAGVNDSDPSIETLRELFEPDPAIATRLRCWITSQRLMWKGLIDHYQQHREEYLAEFARTDHSGPGSLELDPTLDLPDYTRHEIHLQPGGYVGHEFSGPVYHLGTASFYAGQNDADEFHIGLAKTVPIPEDGIVRRVVDLGCGVGQLSVALKERFAEAEVLGLDVGAPLLRYAHHRAADLGVDVRFVQRLAEDTRLPANSVDIVTAYILFHEVPHEAAAKICREALRILRPGGIFNVVDFPTGKRTPPTPYRKFMIWADHAYNCEPWREEYGQADMLQTMTDAGFQAEIGAAKHWGIANYVGTKLG